MNKDPTIYAFILMILGLIMIYYSTNSNMIGPISFIFGELCIAIGVSIIVFIFIYPDKGNKDE